jgi:hypothetical protein
MGENVTKYRSMRPLVAAEVYLLEVTDMFSGYSPQVAVMANRQVGPRWPTFFVSIALPS